jgi:hypothetical protein
MQIEIVDLSSVTGVKDHLCYGFARTKAMAEKKAQTYRTDQPLYVSFICLPEPVWSKENRRGRRSNGGTFPWPSTRFWSTR